jgi:hypothetical protein
VEATVGFGVNNNNTWFLGQYFPYPRWDFSGKSGEEWELFRELKVDGYG